VCVCVRESVRETKMSFRREIRMSHVTLHTGKKGKHTVLTDKGRRDLEKGRAVPKNVFLPKTNYLNLQAKLKKNYDKAQAEAKEQVCCSVLQGVVCCRVFWGGVVCCSVMQCVAGCCRVV